MKQFLPKMFSIALILALALSALPMRKATALSADIVISQVYGGGGNSGGIYTNDFVELFNRGATTVSLAGWSIQYTSATGTGNFGSATNLITPLSGSLAPGQYLLIQEAAGTNVIAPLPTPDIIDSTPINMSGTGAKVALVNTATGLGCNGGSTPCSAVQLAQIIDLVGWDGANFYETAPAPATTNPTAVLRLANGCTETDNNASDFAASAPTPRNTASPLNTCSTGVTLSISDVSVNEGDAGTTTFTFVVTLSSPAGTGGVTFDIATADGTAQDGNPGGDNDYAAQSLTGQTIAEGSTGPFNFDVTVNGDTTVEPDEAFFVDVTNVAGATVADGQGQGTIQNDDIAITFIHDVQGNGAASPLVGQTVVVTGVVVGDFQDGASGTNGDFNGFHIQEEDTDADADPLTSEGIFIFDGNSPAVNVAIGDLVQVQGVVSEFSGLTEITSFTGVSVISSGNPLPTAAALSLPVSNVNDFEPYEGMRVTFPQALVISEYFNFARFGEIVLTSRRHLTPTAEFEPGSPQVTQAVQDYLLDKITLDDGRSAQNPDPAIHPNGGVFDLANLFRGGDTVANVTGIMDFSFGIYRIQPTQGADYVNANPRPAAPEDVEGRLHIASMNTLNFFLTLDTTNSDTGPGPCGGNANLDCRGADANQPLEFTRQRDKLIAALSGLNADVIGLNELENTPGVSPLGDPTNGIVAGLNANYGPGVYSFIDTGVIGTDAIRVGIVYRTTAVVPVGNFQILDSTDDPRFLDTKSRPSLAQTFEEIATGERFTVIVNHFKSKGSACTDIGDPDLGDGQGNCSQTRKAAAEALVDWIATDPTGSGDPDFLIIGDLNSYDKEESIDAILAGGFKDITYQLKGEDAYSYVFDGQTGYLDYMLANPTMFDQVTGITDWHINADEPTLIDYDTSFKGPNQDAIYAPDAYRTSDHDPVLLGLNLVPQCNGKNATVYVRDGVIVGGLHDGQPYNGSLIGTNGDDVIVGTESHDTILALDGNDTVCSGDASDAIFGGAGDDTLLGGGGNDVIFGGAGNDVIEAGDGNDAAFGESGNDTVNGGAGKDAIDGGSGTDTVAGGDENDVVRGGSGSDALDGGAGNDVCNGGSGTDTDTLCEVRIQLP